MIATGPNWHATAAILAAKAGKDIYCEKPCTKNIAQSLALAETFRRTGRVFQAGTQRRNLPHVAFAVELARRGKLGKLHTVYAHPAGMSAGQSGWAAAETEPPKEQVDWDLYLGPAAWRPFNQRCWTDSISKRAAGSSVAESWNGGPTAWTSASGRPTPMAPPRSNIIRRKMARSSLGTPAVSNWSSVNGLAAPGLLSRAFRRRRRLGRNRRQRQVDAQFTRTVGGQKVAEIDGYPATYHVRDFLNCVKSRGKPLCNADVACYGHIACHAANITIYLGRKLTYDPRKNEFLGDDEANRLRSEALRDPWRL